MIDYKAMMEYLDARVNTKTFIPHPETGYILTNEDCEFLLDLMQNYPKTEIEKCFPSTSTSQGITHNYKIELKCDYCDHIEISVNSKTKLFEHLRAVTRYRNGEKKYGVPNGPYICERCKSREQEHYIMRKNEEELEREAIVNQDTTQYIEYFLDPTKFWRPETKNHEKINALDKRGIDRSRVKEYIKGMGYQNFLKTPYWKAIAERTKKKVGFKCQMCNSNEKLATHHRTYDHHGDELYYMEDLVVICEACHAKFHDKLASIEE